MGPWQMSSRPLAAGLEPTILLRTPTTAEWPAILEVAHQAAPWAGHHNEEWLRNRRDFDDHARARRHYVLLDERTQEIVAYGAIEEGPDPGRFRIFVVMGPEQLVGKPGDRMYDCLLSDLGMLEASLVWAREEAVDVHLVSFLSNRGFRETNRYELQDGREVVELSLKLTN
jgi:hypothetical protein